VLHICGKELLDDQHSCAGGAGSQTGLPGENFNKKPNNPEKRPKKGQTDCLKARKRTKLYLLYCRSFVTKKYLNYKNIKTISFEIKIKPCLALYWSTDLPWLFMVYEIAHTGHNGAIVCILIHRQLSAQKSLPFTPVCTYDQNHKNLPLRHNCRISFAEAQTCLQALSLFSAYNTLDTTQCSECTHFQWIRKNLISKLSLLCFALAKRVHWGCAAALIVSPSTRLQKNIKRVE